jgi:hypothetical protein
VARFFSLIWCALGGHCTVEQEYEQLVQDANKATLDCQVKYDALLKDCAKACTPVACTRTPDELLADKALAIDKMPFVIDSMMPDFDKLGVPFGCPPCTRDKVILAYSKLRAYEVIYRGASARVPGYPVDAVYAAVALVNTARAEFAAIPWPHFGAAQHADFLTRLTAAYGPLP